MSDSICCIEAADATAPPPRSTNAGNSTNETSTIETPRITVEFACRRRRDQINDGAVVMFIVMNLCRFSGDGGGAVVVVGCRREKFNGVEDDGGGAVVVMMGVDWR
nr:hypothetical protein [Tanacetum cinerariifolium]